MSRSWTWIPEHTFATTGSTDVTHGETKSKSILEKQQITSRICSVLSVVSGDRRVTAGTHYDRKRTNENAVRSR